MRKDGGSQGKLVKPGSDKQHDISMTTYIVTCVVFPRADGSLVMLIPSRAVSVVLLPNVSLMQHQKYNRVGFDIQP